MPGHYSNIPTGSHCDGIGARNTDTERGTHKSQTYHKDKGDNDHSEICDMAREMQPNIQRNCKTTTRISRRNKGGMQTSTIHSEEDQTEDAHIKNNKEREETSPTACLPLFCFHFLSLFSSLPSLIFASLFLSYLGFKHLSQLVFYLL